MGGGSDTKVDHVIRQGIRLWHAGWLSDNRVFPFAAKQDVLVTAPRGTELIRSNSRRDCIMALFSRLVSYAWNFGRKVVNWIWSHRNIILDWLRNGLAFDVIIVRVRRYLGI